LLWPPVVLKLFWIGLIGTNNICAKKQSFINKGSIAPTRLSAVGYGEYRLVISNDTEKGRRQNRRVEIIIILPPLK